MANTGIIYRRNNKQYFYSNPPIEGEIVFALDTQEYGALVNGVLTWRPHIGLVESVAGKKGKVVLTKDDVGLSNVDNTPDNLKPVSEAVQELFDDHLTAVNPHNITKNDVGLSNVDNTADLDKPISTQTQEALDLKLDASAIPADAKFTDTTYEIKDGELSEFNFNASYKDKLDNLSTNHQLLSNNTAISYLNKVVTLSRADGTTESVTLDFENYNDAEIKSQISNLDSKLNTTNDNVNAVSTRISQDIENLGNLININIDRIREISDALDGIDLTGLTISNIIGLQAELDRKLDWVQNNQTAYNALHFDGKLPSEFVSNEIFTSNNEIVRNNFTNVNNSINTLNELLEQLRSQYSNLNTVVQENKDTINSNTELCNNVNTLVNELNNEITIIEENIDVLDTRVTTLYNELREAIDNISIPNYDEQIAAVNERLDNILVEVQAVIDSIDLSPLTALEQQVNNLQNELNTTNTFIDDFNKKYFRDKKHVRIELAPNEEFNFANFIVDASQDEREDTSINGLLFTALVYNDEPTSSTYGRWVDGCAVVLVSIKASETEQKAYIKNMTNYDLKVMVNLTSTIDKDFVFGWDSVEEKVTNNEEWIAITGEDRTPPQD